MSYQCDQLPYLHNLQLSHPIITETRFKIFLLKGADHDNYWDIVGNHVIRGNGPMAVDFKLGYLLSGPVHPTLPSLQPMV